MLTSFIDRLPDGYHTRIERGGANVSGGQKQRLCIARALLKRPKVLILDDSTSAVDTATDARIRDAFARKIPGTTKIIIAQRISSVEGADRILVLDNGRIDAFDSHENLLKKQRHLPRDLRVSGQGRRRFRSAGVRGGAHMNKQKTSTPAATAVLNRSCATCCIIIKSRLPW